MARVAEWIERVENAKDGTEAFRIANSFLLSQLKKMAESRPDDADAARWHFAREMAKFATAVTRRTQNRKEAGHA